MHWEGARAHIGTRMVLRHIWAPDGCPGTYGHRKSAREQMDTKMQPREVLAL